MVWERAVHAKVIAFSYAHLLPMTCLGMNPYTMVEMWKNYRPLVPDKHQCDTLYAKPAVYVMKMVKDEKVYRAETREVLTSKKYWMSKETIEDMAFGDGGGSI